jgi:hypothetical protein
MCEGVSIYVLLPCAGFDMCALFCVYSFSRVLFLRWINGQKHTKYMGFEIYTTCSCRG